MDPEIMSYMRIPPKPLSRRGTYTLADGATCLAAAPPPTPAAASAAPDAPALTPLMAAGGYDDAIALLDEDMHLVGSLEGHAGGVNALRFASPRVLVSAGEDGTAAVWCCSTRDCRARLACEGVDADRWAAGPWLGLVVGFSW